MMTIAAKVHFFKDNSVKAVVSMWSIGTEVFLWSEANSTKLKRLIQIHKRLWNFQTVIPWLSQTCSWHHSRSESRKGSSFNDYFIILHIVEPSMVSSISQKWSILVQISLYHMYLYTKSYLVNYIVCILFKSLLLVRFFLRKKLLMLTKAAIIESKTCQACFLFLHFLFYFTVFFDE